MKFLICSDIHGSALNLEKIVDIYKKEKADKLIILGDIYNHGPRNPLPEGFAEMSVSQILNGIKERLIVVKGNCDSQVDTMISDFDFNDNLVLESGGKLIFLTHGHEYNMEYPPKTKYDAIIYGHLHTGFILCKNDTVFANCGSISLPKGGTPKSYLILDGTTLSLYNLDGLMLEKIHI